MKKILGQLKFLIEENAFPDGLMRQLGCQEAEVSPWGAREKALAKAEKGMKQIPKGCVNRVSLWGALISYTL
jgi:hypothetical protein